MIFDNKLSAVYDDLKKGDSVVIFAPSGSGKTHTIQKLRQMSGFSQYPIYDGDDIIARHLGWPDERNWWEKVQYTVHDPKTGSIHYYKPDEYERAVGQTISDFMLSNRGLCLFGVPVKIQKLIKKYEYMPSDGEHSYYMYSRLAENASAVLGKYMTAEKVKNLILTQNGKDDFWLKKLTDGMLQGFCVGEDLSKLRSDFHAKMAMLYDEKKVPFSGMSALSDHVDSWDEASI